MQHEHVFRQSWLGTYWECPEQARLVLRGEYPFDETEAAAKGTAVHSAIEAVISGCADFDTALQVGVDEFRNLSTHEGFRWVQVKRERTCLEHIKGGLSSWWNYVRPQLGATAWCEHPFKFIFHEDAERVIWLSGTADYAEHGSGIQDWKLTSNEDKYGKDKWKLQRFGVQPSVYAEAARYDGLFGLDEDVPFRYVALNPQGRKPQVVPCVRTPADSAWLKAQLITIAEHIEQGTERTWPLRDQSALCSAKWCTNWSNCKGKHLTIGSGSR